MSIEATAGLLLLIGTCWWLATGVLVVHAILVPVLDWPRSALGWFYFGTCVLLWPVVMIGRKEIVSDIRRAIIEQELKRKRKRDDD